MRWLRCWPEMIWARLTLCSRSWCRSTRSLQTTPESGCSAGGRSNEVGWAKAALAAAGPPNAAAMVPIARLNMVGLRSLRDLGFRGALSLELFNRDYWKQDANLVARTGLAKMKTLVRQALA